MIDGVMLTKVSIIPGSNGDVLHALKNDEQSFHGFGEAYMSTIKRGAIKAWKRHKKMTLNLVVPFGRVKFVIYDSRPKSPSRGEIFDVTLSREHYLRLTIPPMVWFGFKGVGDGLSMVLNVADIKHDPDECEQLDPSENKIPYDWSNAG